jgi:hypothetical protein
MTRKERLYWKERVRAVNAARGTQAFHDAISALIMDMYGMAYIGTLYGLREDPLAGVTSRKELLFSPYADMYMRISKRVIAIQGVRCVVPVSSIREELRAARARYALEVARELAED